MNVDGADPHRRPGSGALRGREAAASDEDDDASDGIETKAQIIALIVTFAIFLFVLDLVRRRRLSERYAIIWMIAALALLVLSIWTGGLDAIADLMGIQEPANAIFIIAFAVGFLLLLNFSVVSSRLGEETKVLAQEVARLEQELRMERSLRGGDENGFSGRARSEESQGRPASTHRVAPRGPASAPALPRYAEARAGVSERGELAGADPSPSPGSRAARRTRRGSQRMTSHPRRRASAAASRRPRRPERAPARWRGARARAGPEARAG